MDNGEYVIEEGDTLTKIAFKNQISIFKLKKLNNIDTDDYLYPGRKIRIQESQALPAEVEIDDVNQDDVFAPTLVRKRSNSISSIIKGVKNNQNSYSLSRMNSDD